MPNTTPNLGLPKLLDNQATGRDRYNETLMRLDAFIGGLKFLEMDKTAPPGSPSDGDTYHIGASATGDWNGQDGNIAVYDSDAAEWLFLTPHGGLIGEDAGSSYQAGELMRYSAQEDEWHPVYLRWDATEYWTGRYKNSKKLYAKLIDLGSLPNIATKNVAHSITGLDIESVEFIGSADNGSTGLQPYTNAVNGALTLHANSTNVVAGAGWNASAYSGKALMLYTRT